jgi:cytochrome c oxidase cbb3-type subunit 1
VSSADVAPAAADVTVVETCGRWPLLFLFGSGVGWLVVSGVIALIAGIQLHAPGFLADCPILTHGRAQALAETAFVYGWLANLGLGLALWVLGRLGGEPLRAANWITAGAVFWNLGITLGLVGIVTDGATAVPFLELPRGIQPLLLVAYGAIAVGGVLAWTGRRREVMFASHWYAIAALFLFPWLSSIAQVLLLWSPVRGVLQGVVAGWYAQGIWTLWLAPLALSAVYYVVPKCTGKVLPSYDFAPLGFWCLLFIGGWTGGRHLIGGPVPAWISTIAIVASALLLFHYFIVWLNLRGALAGGAVALRFISFGLVAYVLGGVIDALTGLRAVAVVTQFTYFDEAQRQLALYGAVSMMLCGALYYALPRLTGRPWAWGGLICAHLTLAGVGIVLLVVALAGAGLVQGSDLNDTAIPLAAIAAHTHAWLVCATVAQVILLGGNLLFAINFCKSALCPFYAAFAAERLRSGAAAEASAS